MENMSWLIGLRQLLYKPPRSPPLLRRAFSQSSGINKVNKLSENPYFDKYADKIEKRMRNEPEDIEARLKLNAAIIDANLGLAYRSVTADSLEMKNVKCNQLQTQKDLSQIMKLDMVREKTAKQIECIWRDYYEVKDGVYAVVPGGSFAKMERNFKEFPYFLFPLPRPEGYEFMFCQFLDNSCYFASLKKYQILKENTPVCLTVTYFKDFQEDKGIVLMRGEFDKTVLLAHEAQCLANQLTLYYGSNDEERQRLVHDFNKDPESFHHMDLIADYEESLGRFA